MNPGRFECAIATAMSLIMTLFAIGQWGVRLHSWTDLQVFTMRAALVVMVVFAWTMTAFMWRDILKRNHKQ